MAGHGDVAIVHSEGHKLDGQQVVVIQAPGRNEGRRFKVGVTPGTSLEALPDHVLSYDVFDDELEFVVSEEAAPEEAALEEAPAPAKKGKAQG